MSRIDMRLPDGSVAGKIADTVETEAALAPLGLKIASDELNRRYLAVASMDIAETLPGFIDLRESPKDRTTMLVDALVTAGVIERTQLPADFDSSAVPDALRSPKVR